MRQKHKDIESGDSMKIKVIIKWVLDILMTIALFFLMGYQFWGEKVHEWVGVGMFVLFIAHQICNYSWYRNLFRRKYTCIRIFQLIINIMTFTAMAALIYSGITMSRHVFEFLPIQGRMALARRLHILGSYWGFLFMSLHLGLHWGMILNIILTKGRKKVSIAGFIVSMVIAVYGVCVFIKRDFLTYMFLHNEFVFLNYEEAKWRFFLDYFALMGLCVFVAHYSAKLLRKTNNFKKKESENHVQSGT